MTQKLVIASNNAGKLRELSALLAPLGYHLLPQSELAIPEAEEPHPTFVENALAKARHAARLSGLPAIADDSGLCVEALAGAPGIHSARFAGEPKSDARNNEKLLAALADSPDRRAHYVCVLVFVRHAYDPQPIIAEGEWHGDILTVARGAGGFGYDPLFRVANSELSVAEMPSEEKNRVSHRALAMANLLARMRNIADTSTAENTDRRHVLM